MLRQQNLTTYKNDKVSSDGDEGGSGRSASSHIFLNRNSPDFFFI